MSNQEMNKNSLFEENLNYKREITHLKQLVSNTSDLEKKVDSQINEIKKLEEELKLSEEKTEKTKEYILLKLESVLDKQDLEFIKHNNTINENNKKLDSIPELKKEIDSIKSSILIQEKEFKIILSDKNTEINSLKKDINNYKTQIKENEENLKEFKSKLVNKDDEIEFIQNRLDELEDTLLDNEEELKNTKEELVIVTNQSKNTEIIKNKYKELFEIKNKIVDDTKNQLKNKNNEINSFKNSIKSYEDKIQNKDLEIEYLYNNNKFTKLIFQPMAYLLILFKSKPNEIGLNIKLYKNLRKNKCFDIGFYLNKYHDVKKSKWCKYFSPELHYVCNGFDEKRKINEKCLTNLNKKDFLEYINNQ